MRISLRSVRIDDSSQQSVVKVPRRTETADASRRISYATRSPLTRGNTINSISNSPRT